MPTPPTVSIVPFRDDFAADFDRLNRAWLVAGGFLEPADDVYLRNPRTTIIDTGGEIFCAVSDGRVVGTAAAIPHGTAIELAKVCVDPSHQGLGLGRRLTATVIDFARAQGASTVVLTSNTRLHVAVGLYRSLGFVEAPCPDGFGYLTADIYMQLALRDDVTPRATSH